MKRIAIFIVTMDNKILFAVFSLLFTSCLCQDELKRPTFPDVFQTSVQGIFIKEKEVVEMDASLYYDRINNRAAFQYTTGGDTSRTIYNFDTNEMVSFEGYDCNVNKMEDDPNQSFFPFTSVKGKKIISGPEDVLYFSNSKLERQDIQLIPTLVYSAKIDIPSYGRKDCDVTHYFSKKIDMPKCRSSDECDPTLMTITVNCDGNEDDFGVNHVYNFFRFISGIEDDSIFLPPPGVYCDIANTKEFPYFNSYFSFSYDTALKTIGAKNDTSVVSTHKEVWYDKGKILLRIDEYDENGLMTSSRVMDLISKVSFVIVPIESKCYIYPVKSTIDFALNTQLPKIFFSGNDSSAKEAIYVGKRSINGLIYDVWTFTWTDKASDAKVVEEVFFLDIIPDYRTNLNPTETFLKISHVDIYKYETKEQQMLELSVIQHYTINNYRTDPKDWAAFDIADCYDHTKKKEFYMNVNGTGNGIVKESISYPLVVEHMYNKIVEETGISLLRISELKGVFDGTELVGIKGSIIDNGEGSGFSSKEPSMNETFDLLKTAASEGKLKIYFRKEYDKENWLMVSSVEDPTDQKEPEEPKCPKEAKEENNCYSGGSMAAASLVLLLLGFAFGIAGYYVFLKKRRSANSQILMKNME